MVIIFSQIIIWFISIVFIFILTTMLLACVCCHKQVQKDDLLGLDGMVKLTNPDENVNNVVTNTNNNVNNLLLSNNCNVTGSNSIRSISHNNDRQLHFHHDTTVSIETINNSARPSGGSNSNRSLPDIPHTTEPGVTEITIDTNSEIYATVEDKIVPVQLTKNYGDDDYSPRTASISTGIDNSSTTRPSLSQQSSLSQADAPYARLKSDHPYDKLKKEHPYACVQKSSATDRGTTTLNGCAYSDQRNEISCLRTTQNLDRNSNDIVLIASHSQATNGVSISNLIGSNNVTSVNTDGPPLAPPRSRRSSSHLSLHNTSNNNDTGIATSANNENTVDIPAATAVAGRVAASQDLPYMTPPQLQQNFSGDSQDSSKGYTSISVREPLANILAQTQTVRSTRRQELTDSHYATVSDDSDEMYAAIEEPNQQIYNSGSETYAQIQPTPPIENTSYNSVVDNTKTDENCEASGNSPAPQPPSVDSLKQVAHVHSRQASSSSCTSSVANLGSPKPEKRQANSPLPPRPPVSPEPPRLSTTSLISKNLEDMYAKVHKNSKKKSKDSITSDDLDRRHSGLSMRGDDVRISIHSVTDSPSLLSSQDSICHQSRHPNNYDNEYLNSNYDKPDFVKSKFEHCYEKINSASTSNSLPQRQLPTPAIINLYDQGSGPDSLFSNDPGYEVLHKTGSRPPSDCDPNYEVLKPNYSSLKRTPLKNKLYSSLHKKNTTDPGYESVKHFIDAVDEPNYESMPNSDCTDEPAYASVTGIKCSGVDSETDSNRDDPNYESVKYYRKDDMLTNNSQSDYEKIKRTNNNNNLKPEDIDKISENSINLDGYERVGINRISSIPLDQNNLTENSTVIHNLVPIVSIENESTSMERRNSISPTQLSIPSTSRRGSVLIEDGVYKV